VFERRSTQYLYANATARAVEGDLGGFLRVARYAQRNRPLGKVGQPRFLHSDTN
jgi:hypothetical protein